jgi:hypothetical protein
VGARSFHGVEPHDGVVEQNNCAPQGLHQQLALYHTYYNFCLPHASLRRPLPQPLPTNGAGSARCWQPCTPAMAAGLTDHVWSLKEVLLYRVPPWPQPQAL